MYVLLKLFVSWIVMWSCHDGMNHCHRYYTLVECFIVCLQFCFLSIPFLSSFFWCGYFCALRWIICNFLIFVYHFCAELLIWGQVDTHKSYLINGQFPPHIPLWFHLFWTCYLLGSCLTVFDQLLFELLVPLQNNIVPNLIIHKFQI